MQIIKFVAYFNRLCLSPIIPIGYRFSIKNFRRFEKIGEIVSCNDLNNGKLCYA